MNKPAKLSEIIEGMDFQFDETSSFLNTRTGQVVSVGDDDLRAAEDEKVVKLWPEWQRDNIQIAKEILEEDYYVRLPSKFDINEYSVMEDFCLSLSDERISNKLLNYIKGRGAFRRFKDEIYRLGIEEDWYKYRDNAFKEMAIDWCKDNGVEFIDE